MVRHAGDRTAAGAVLTVDPARVDRELERAEGQALGAIYSGLPDGWVGEVDGWAVRSWPRRPDSTWMHQAFAERPVTGPGLDQALEGLAALPVNVQVPVGALADSELRSRGLGSPVRLARFVGLLGVGLLGGGLLGGVAPAGSPAPDTDLRLETVGPPGGGHVSTVARAAFGLDEPWWWVAPLGAPGWTQVVAYDDDEPVATAALHRVGEVAWLGAAGTLPEARGRGAQTALLRHRLRLAAELGASRVVAKAVPGSVSERNLMRAGFVRAYDVVQWSRPAAPRSPAAGPRAST